MTKIKCCRVECFPGRKKVRSGDGSDFNVYCCLHVRQYMLCGYVAGNKRVLNTQAIRQRCPSMEIILWWELRGYLVRRW